MKLLDFFPQDIDFTIKSNIIEAWNNQITRNILLLLSEKEHLTAPEIRENIGHSMSTLHESIKKLQYMNLIDVNMVYKENKKKILTPKILFVTKNPKYKSAIKKFFQGLWVNSDNSKAIIEFLKSNPESYYTAVDISSKTQIPVDDVELELNNWDSFTTRGIRAVAREIPFEKKVMYRIKD
jgi:hypothetical protein